MSSKLMHVRDTSIVERRLRPIYEWLDNGVNKKALQECDKVLKKTPSLQCAKALKAIALLRLGKAAESRAILDGLLAEYPTDDSTLQAISICYRESNELEKICKVYEVALAADKTSEELHSHLFMSYVRVGNFREQQRVAMSLYKLRSRPPYCAWAAMSAVLQATRGPDAGDPQRRAVLLHLAERMMSKLIAQTSQGGGGGGGEQRGTQQAVDASSAGDGDHELRLYVRVLELQAKHADVLRFLETAAGARLLDGGGLPFGRLPYLVALGEWRRVNLHCKRALADSIDKWNIWMEYLNSVFELMRTSTTAENHYPDITENGNGTIDSVDDTPEKAHEFICSLIENGINGFGQRGPYLARIELCYRLTERGADTSDLLGDPTNLFVEYFRRFGHKPCCVSDLREYLRVLDPNRRAVLCEGLLRDSSGAADVVPNTVDAMRRHITAVQLSRLSSAHAGLPADALRELARALAARHRAGRDRHHRGLLPTDEGPADAYALVAAHALRDAARRPSEASEPLRPEASEPSEPLAASEPLVLAAAGLAALLRDSRSCFQARLLLARLYHELGGGVGAQTVYDGLDLKHIQLDSLGYVHCARLPATGLLTLAAAACDSTIKFFVTNYRDSSDHLTFAYKYGSFLKINEFMDFREKLYNSLHYTTVVCDRIILTLMHCNSLEGITANDFVIKDREIDWDLASDNNDLSVYPCWDPERVGAPPEQWPANAELFRQNVAFARLRSELVRTLAAAHDAAARAGGRGGARPADALRKRLAAWRHLHRQVADAAHAPVTEKFVSLPLPSRLHGYLETPYLKCLAEHIALFIQLSETTEDSSDSSRNIETIKSINDQITTNASRLIEAQLESPDPYRDRRRTLELITNYVEIATLSSFIIMLSYELSRPPHGGKKGKRKTDIIGGKEVINELVIEQQRFLSGFVEILDRWETPPERPEAATEDVVKRLGSLRIEKSIYDGVISDLEMSLTCALRDLKNVLTSKSKALPQS